MKISDYDYELPRDRIAQHPARPRNHSRLLVLHRQSGRLEEARFDEIDRWLRPGDCLVANDSRVEPVRLRARWCETEGRTELLLLSRHRNGTARALVRSGRRLRTGLKLVVGDGAATVELVERLPDGDWLVRASCGSFEEAIARFGETPLPPYIVRRDPEQADAEDYQTCYARSDGSVAAPTAGLHFTPDLIDRIRSRGIGWTTITLHIGWGTFRPVRARNPSDHPMASERYEISHAAADRINRTRRDGGRIVAVGTSVARVLETVADLEGRVRPQAAETDLMILPGHAFRAVSALITNFHLPRTTLLLLVSAFAGREHILQAYREAIAKGFRFYSYGDAMLIAGDA